MFHLLQYVHNPHNCPQCFTIFIIIHIVHHYSQFLPMVSQFHRVPQSLESFQWFTNVRECWRLLSVIHAIQLLFTAVCGGSRCSRCSRLLRIVCGCLQLFTAVRAGSCSFGLSFMVKLPHNLSQFHISFLLVIGCYALLVTDIWCLHYC